MTIPPERVLLRVSAVLCSAVLALSCGSSGVETSTVNRDAAEAEGDAGDVVLFDNELDEYLDSAADSTPAELAGQYRTSLTIPIAETCIHGGEYRELAASIVNAPINDTATASEALAELDAEAIEASLNEELQELQQALPGPPVTVCVVIAGDETADFISAEMNGVTGVTAGAGQVILVIDPPTMSDEALRYTLAHEYHHSWWTSHQPMAPNFTLLDYLLFEGRADAFASLQHPDHAAPWTDRLTRQQIRDHWTAIEPDLESQDPFLLQAVMFGGGPFPQWTGYTTGVRIVQDFIAANPASAPDQWGLMPAAELLALSGFATP